MKLETARLLLVNDDGIHAPGFAVLEAIARSLSPHVWVVAPEGEQSCKSHSLTLERPLRIKDMGERRYCIDGTPSDCSLIAINHIMRDNPPDLVLSGVNFGRNAGVEVIYSGTVAAAREAAILGISAIAMSAEILNGEPDFETPKQHAADVIKKLTAQMPWPRGCVMNVNFPHRARVAVQGMRVVSHLGGKTSDEVMMREDRWGNAYYWVGHSVYDKYQDGTDVHALEEGYISITPLHTDLTDYGLLEKMRSRF